VRRVADERKVVTVLFADCVGSTTIGELLDPEELAVVMRTFFDEMRTAIEAQGGVVEKFIGDAVMALFGVPSSHEDDPARALRCALDMQDRLDRINVRLERAHGVQLGLRVGINTGEVLVSDEPGADLGMVTGDAVNIAARLEQRGAPGQIVVSERTARSARGFRFEELGPLELRGKSSPVRACLLTSTRAPGAPGAAERGIPGLSAPMVGREHELALLEAVVTRSMAESRPHLMTVYGEAGVGKSRLVKELVEWTEDLDEPPLVVRGRCLPYGNGATYWPMAEVLKDLATVRDSDPAPEALAKLHAMGARLLMGEPEAEIDRVVAALAATAGIVEPGSPLAELSPHELRVEMHAAWRTVLSRLASDSPVLAVIEDIHWADAALLDLLEEIAERAFGALVLVCPSRPDLTARRPGWGGGRRNASAIALEPLSRTDTSRLVSLLLDIDDLPETVRSRILERAEGNPFFLEEILRQLIDEGRIVHDRGRWRASPTAADVHIPDTVQSVLAARIDLLPPVPKKVLQHAAVVGRVFWTGSLGERGPEGVDEHLDVLEGRDLISTRLGSAFRGERECIFRHILTCNVAYESIPRRDRANLHAQVAAWLDDVAGGRQGEFAELLAHHWAEAHRGAVADPSTTDAEIERRRELAYRWCLAAAKENHRRALIDRAITFGDQALALAASADEVADAAEEIGHAHRYRGEGSPAMTAYRRGADALLAAQGADPIRAAHLCALVAESVARWQGMLSEPYDAVEIRRYLDHGLQLAGDGDSEAKARLFAVRSFWAWGVREEVEGAAGTSLAEREQTAREAAEMAARLGLPDLEAGALDALTTCLVDQRRYRAAAEANARRLLLLPRVHDLLEQGDVVCMAASTYFVAGDYAGTVATASRARDELETSHWGTLLHAMSWRSLANLLRGRWDDVLADLERGSSIVQTVGLEQPPPFSCSIWTTSACVHAARGRGDEVDRLVAMLPARVGPDGDHPTPAGALAIAYVRLGRAEAARRRMRAIDFGLGLGDALRCLGELDVAVATGDWSGATTLITDRLKTPDAEGPPAPYLACAAELAGRQALAVGDPASARRGLAEALTRWSALGARWPAARVELALADTCREVDAGMAADHAGRALAVFEELGCPDEIAHARLLLAD
jgi:class 3 adenylate cyclase